MELRLKMSTDFSSRKKKNFIFYSVIRNYKLLCITLKKNHEMSELFLKQYIVLLEKLCANLHCARKPKNLLHVKMIVNHRSKLCFGWKRMIQVLRFLENVGDRAQC